MISFRTSEAARYNYYNLIDSLYSDETFQKVNLTLFNASSVTLVDIYNHTAHNKNDMIVRYVLSSKKEPVTVQNAVSGSLPCHGGYKFVGLFCMNK